MRTIVVIGDHLLTVEKVHHHYHESRTMNMVRLGPDRIEGVVVSAMRPSVIRTISEESTARPDIFLN